MLFGVIVSVTDLEATLARAKTLLAEEEAAHFRHVADERELTSLLHGALTSGDMTKVSDLALRRKELQGRIAKLAESIASTRAACERTEQLRQEERPRSASDRLRAVGAGLEKAARSVVSFASSTKNAVSRLGGWIDELPVLGAIDCGKTRLANGDYKGAIAECEDVMKQRPDLWQPYNNRSVARRLLANYQGALVDADKAVRMAPAETFPLCSRALALIALGEHKKAVHAATRALGLDTRSAYALSVRANAHSRLGDTKAAIADASEALRIDGKNLLALAVRANARRGTPDAIADLRKAIEVLPCGAYHALLGESLVAAGDMRGAITAFDEAERLSPSEFPEHHNRALAWQALGDYERAIVEATKAVAEEPGDADTRKIRGRCHALAGRRAEAIDDLNKGAELAPDDAYVALWIAGLGGGTERLTRFAGGTDWSAQLARIFLGDPREAVLAAARAAATDKERAEHVCEAHGYLGMHEELQGDKTRAFEDYEACLATGVRHFIEYWWARARLDARSRAAGGGAP